MDLADIAQKRLDFSTFGKSKDGFSGMVVGFSCHVMLDFPAGVLLFPRLEVICWLSHSHRIFGQCPMRRLPNARNPEVVAFGLDDKPLGHQFSAIFFHRIPPDIQRRGGIPLAQEYLAIIKPVIAPLHFQIQRPRSGHERLPRGAIVNPVVKLDKLALAALEGLARHHPPPPNFAGRVASSGQQWLAHVPCKPPHKPARRRWLWAGHSQKI